MGITISFNLRSPSAIARQSIDQLQTIAQDLPFDYVGEVVELVGKQCNYQSNDTEELLVLKIQAVAKRIEQGKLKKYKPDHIIGFTVIPGKGCEFLTVFLLTILNLEKTGSQSHTVKPSLQLRLVVSHTLFFATLLLSPF